MSSAVEKCSVKDQFCEGVADRTCVSCGEGVCGACSVAPEGSTHQDVCHRCLRAKGGFNEVVAEAHLRQLGGAPKVAEQKPWGPVRQ